MEIQEVNLQNLSQAAEIHALSWQEAHRDFCSAEFVAQHSVARQMAYLRREMEAGKRLFMLTDHQPVGIVSVDGNLIENLYVLPQKQRKGYGTELLKFAIAQCVDIPTLWVLNRNSPACAFYRKHGFRETGERKQLRSDLFETEMILPNIMHGLSSDRTMR